MQVIDNSVLILVGIVLAFIAVIALIFIKKGKGGLTINKEGISVSVDKGEGETQASSSKTSSKEESSSGKNSPSIDNSPNSKTTTITMTNKSGDNVGRDKIVGQASQGKGSKKRNS